MRNIFQAASTTYDKTWRRETAVCLGRVRTFHAVGVWGREVRMEMGIDRGTVWKDLQWLICERLCMLCYGIQTSSYQSVLSETVQFRSLFSGIDFGDRMVAIHEIWRRGGKEKSPWAERLAWECDLGLGKFGVNCKEPRRLDGQVGTEFCDSHQGGVLGRLIWKGSVEWVITKRL